MSLLVVGCNHHSADLALLERLAVPAEEHAKALRSLLGLEHVLEVAVLSTCNRVEVYAHTSRFHPGLQEVRGWLAERADIHPQDLDEVEYSYYDDRAAAHLFAVAGGLDSMVVGERQIAVQVKQAMETARAEDAARRVLQRLFRQAVHVGRRVRRETAISAGASSMVDVGLGVAARPLGGQLAGRDVLLMGAGKMGGLTADRLRSAGAGRVTVWNRSPDRAARVAARVDGEVVPDGGLRAAVAGADLVVCTTGAPEPILDAELVGDAVAGRASSPLVLLDLAMPHDVDVACRRLPGVEVVDIADVRELTHARATGRVLAEAREIVDAEAADFSAWTRAIEVEPTIRSVRRHAEQIRREELDRLGGRLAGLDERQRETVDALTRGIVNTLLHHPTVRLKELADHGGAEHHASLLRELFDLDDDDAAGGGPPAADEG